MTKETYTIRLMNGSELDGILKSELPKKIISDQLRLDTTGQYLTVGAKPKTPHENDMKLATRLYDQKLFTDNAWFLLNNAERVFSDSRMFLSPVRIQNGLAYSGTSGFWQPTVGVYLEWWLNFEKPAIDKNGNLVWYISGSPLSGSNCCCSVKPDGEVVDISQRTSFMDIYRSFMRVNNRYTEAKQKCEAYTLEETLIRLRGDEYKFQILELKHEMLETVLNERISTLERSLQNQKEKHRKLIMANKRLILDYNASVIAEFYREYSEYDKKVKELETVYIQKRKELKRQFHRGTIEGDYKAMLAEISRNYKTMKREQSERLSQFVKEIFGKNPNNITPTDVIRFASGRPLPPFN